MASVLFPAPILYRCYYCQLESTANAFKYFDNEKVEQPRHQCHNCHKLFTLGSHGRLHRPQGRTYAKKRNENPEELKNLSRECRHCGVADNAPFMYYNNNHRLQPRFKCLSCGKQFQMRLMGTGGEMHLVHTSCNQRQATGRRKKGAMPLPVDPLMPLEPGMRLLPENCGEDEESASFLEAESIDEDEEAPDANPIIHTLNEVYGLPLGVSAADNSEFLAFLEAAFLTNGNEATNDDNIYSTGVRADESNDVEMDLENMTNMNSDCTSNREVVSGTMLVETLAPVEQWSNDTLFEDSPSLNNLNAALACCNFMDDNYD